MNNYVVIVDYESCVL